MVATGPPPVLAYTVVRYGRIDLQVPSRRSLDPPRDNEARKMFYPICDWRGASRAWFLHTVYPFTDRLRASLDLMARSMLSMRASQDRRLGRSLLISDTGRAKHLRPCCGDSLTLAAQALRCSRGE